MATTNFAQEITSKDEIDFVRSSHNNNNNNNNHQHLNNNVNIVDKKVPKTQQQQQQQHQQQHNKTPKDRLTIFGFSRKSKTLDEKFKKESKTKSEKDNNTTSTTDFDFACPAPLTTPVPIGTPPRHYKFVKSSSISRFLGSTYSAKKFDKEEKKALAGKFNTYGGRRRSGGSGSGGGLYLQRLKRYSKDDNDLKSPVVLIEKTSNTNACDSLCSEMLTLEHFHESHAADLGSKALRTISRGLGKLWWKRTHSVDISLPDPEFKVSYLGNVLTGWAKGEGCVEKQLNTLWRNYTQNNKPDVIMRLKVCASGLKATTRQHGLTEYWANRITHCCAPKNYPRVFCWIYRHEGRKLKHELRCHAVLCSKEKQVQEISDTLKANLECALREFKREKILKQNARLSLANAVYDNPSLPRRKILLSVGSNNYRPPLERSKSAPKLMAIEEAIGEEGEEMEETNEPEMKSCCQKDSLYPAMTLGRRRCRKGHSIRRTGKLRPISCGSSTNACCAKQHKFNDTKDTKEAEVLKRSSETNYGSDDSDDFEKILKHNDYDSNASLTNELLPYFERQLNKNISSSCGSLSDLKVENVLAGGQEEEDEPLSLLPCINDDPNADPVNDFNPNQLLDLEKEESDQIIGLRRAGVCSDGEDDFLVGEEEEEEDMYFRQAAILTMLHRHSMRKMANLSLSSDEGSSSLETNSSGHIKHQQQSSISSEVSSASNTNQQTDSKRISTDSADEGSISSGCETASTVTNNQDDLSLKYRQTLQQFRNADHESVEPFSLNSAALTTEEIFEHLHKRSSSDAATTFSSSSSITLKMDCSPTNSLNNLNLPDDSPKLSPSNSLISTTTAATTTTLTTITNLQRPRRMRRQRDIRQDSDSECSDESGYVEYQERETTTTRINKLEQQPKPQIPVKPQIPPKPMPRKYINLHNTTNTTIPTTTTV